MKEKFTEYLNAREAGFSHLESLKLSDLPTSIVLRIPQFPSAEEVEAVMEQELLRLRFDVLNSPWRVFRLLQLPWPSFVCQVVKESCIVNNSVGLSNKFAFSPRLYATKVEKIKAVCQF